MVRPRIIVAVIALMACLSAFGEDDATATAKQDAVAAMKTWLGEIDGASYAQSWTEAAPTFKTAVTSETWVSTLIAVTTPAGKVVARQLASALFQKSVFKPDGTRAPGGPLVIAQFSTSFENIKFALETVTFEKESDGPWRAVGYYIKPR